MIKAKYLLPNIFENIPKYRISCSFFPCLSKWRDEVPLLNLALGRPRRNSRGISASSTSSPIKTIT